MYLSLASLQFYSSLKDNQTKQKPKQKPQTLSNIKYSFDNQ